MQTTIASLIIRSLRWLVLCCVLLCSHNSHALEFVGAVHGGVRFTQQNNFFNPTSKPLRFDQQRTGAQILLGALGLLHFNDQFELYATLDIGQLFIGNYGKTDEDNRFSVLLNNRRLNTTSTENDLLSQLQTQCEQQVQQLQQQGRTQLTNEHCQIAPWFLMESFFLRELYVSVYPDKRKVFHLSAGMMRYTLGNGFIYDNYGLGVRFEVNFKKLPKAPPLHLTFNAFLPDSSFTQARKTSPVLHLDVTWTPHKDHQFGVFASYLYDGNHLAGQLLLPLWQDIFANEWNEKLYKISGENPKLSCYAAPDMDALKSLLPKETRQQQEACEQDNATREKNGQDPQLCPLDESILIPYEQTCTIPDSSGHHVWFGLHGKTRLGKLRVKGQAILYLSKMQVGLPKSPKLQLPASHSEWASGTTLTNISEGDDDPFSPDIQDKHITGLAFSSELTLTYQWNPAFTTTFFMLFASGDNFNSANPAYAHTFMGISPQLRYTHVFFQGGINDYSSRPGISISGISGNGFLAMGLIMRYYVEDQMELKFTSAPLFSHTLPTKIGEDQQADHFYGLEMNLLATYKLLSWLRPVLQIDLFFPGGFFQDSNPPLALFQLQLGFNVLF